MRLEETVEIARPPDAVWSYLADVANLPRWQGAVDRVEWKGGEAVAGDAFREERTFLGRRVANAVEVVAAEPGREFTVATTAGPVDVTARHLLEPAGSGTLLRVEVEAKRVPRLMAGMAVRAARKQAAEDLARLKRLLEGE